MVSPTGFIELSDMFLTRMEVIRVGGGHAPWRLHHHRTSWLWLRGCATSSNTGDDNGSADDEHLGCLAFRGSEPHKSLLHPFRCHR